MQLFQQRINKCNNSELRKIYKYTGFVVTNLLQHFFISLYSFYSYNYIMGVACMPLSLWALDKSNILQMRRQRVPRLLA